MQQQGASFETSHWHALAALWRGGALCDVQLQAAGGERLAAHSIVLASASTFFRALLCGAGRSMREGACSSSTPAQHSPGPAAAAASASGHGAPPAPAAGQLAVVELPYSAQQLTVLLEALYDHTLDVHAGNVTWLLDMGAYLGVPPLQDAACQFLAAALSPESVADVLLLAHHYHCTSLQSEGVQYLAQRLASLLVMPDVRQGLLRLPESLLQQLLCCEGLEVEQETELLCMLADWVCCSWQEREQHLPQLLPLLQLCMLPQEQLSQQQLRSCSSPDAAALAQELHRAAQQCHSMPHRHMHAGGGKQLAGGQPPHHQSPNKQRKLMPAGDLAHAPACSSSSSTHLHGAAAAGCVDGRATPQPQRLLFAAAPAAQQHSHSGPEGSSSSTWWAHPDLDANNRACSETPDVGSSSGGGGGGAGCGGAHATHADMLPGDSSGACSKVPAGQPPLLPAAHGGGASPSGSCVPGRLWVLAEPARVGAAVLDAWPGRLRGSQPSGILVAGGHDPSWRGLKSVEVYDPTADAWSLGPALPAALPFAGAGLPARGQLYVIGGPMCSSYMARFDAANQVWHACDGPLLSRLHAAVTGVSGLLYLTGGRTQVNQVVSAVEAYEPASLSWRQLPDMLQPRYAHALVPHAGCLYALGGQAHKAIHRTVEVFDPQHGSWQALAAELAADRKYCAAAALGGRLMVVGGLNEARCRLGSVEAYDPREGRWTSLAAMQCPRSSCSVAALAGSLYVCGGSAGDDRLHSSVEAFDAAAGRWRACAPLSCHRSGLTAAAV